jgi:hypothetical protein
VWVLVGKKEEAVFIIISDLLQGHEGHAFILCYDYTTFIGSFSFLALLFAVHQ